MTEVEALLTKEDVCRILGVKDWWLDDEIAAGRIPHIRLGKRKMIRFRPAHLKAYLDAREITNEDRKAEEVPPTEALP